MSKYRYLIAPVFCLIALSGCATTPSAHSLPAPDAMGQIFEDMGPFKRTITTDSEMAQRYFDQGLTWTYAFNHDEAIRSFQEATRLDPDCGMAWWGIAISRSSICRPAYSSGSISPVCQRIW